MEFVKVEYVSGQIPTEAINSALEFVTQPAIEIPVQNEPRRLQEGL